MKIIEYIDENGFKRKRMIRDNDPDRLAIEGIPLEPPDLDLLDWANLKKELYNNLFARNLVSWKDVQQSQDGVTSAILSTFRKKVINLYKEVR